MPFNEVRMAFPEELRTATSLRIYLDESWPDEKPDTGVLAGIVWGGDAPDYSILPKIHTHLLRAIRITNAKERRRAENRQRDAASAVKNLKKCSNCFPFAMPMQVDRGRAMEQYDSLVMACLQILLGWLLPQGNQKVKVEVFLERISGRHPSINWFAGALEGAAQGAPGRFQRWQLERVEWNDDKEFEYVPYGDLLAYLALQHHPRSQNLAAEVDFHSWMGFVPLSLELVPRMMRLDGLQTAENVNDVLDLVRDLGFAPLTRLILADLQPRFQAQRSLQQKLLEGLDERYRAKDRNLARLRPQFEAVLQLVPESKQDSGVRLPLLYTAVALQNANHDGDPERVRQSVEAYEMKRQQTAIHDRELAAFVDLNLAVHYADRFDFAQAEKLLEQLRSDASFAFLTPLTRGWIHSSLGQCRAMQGRHGEAEASFIEALALYDQSDLSPEKGAAERDQTGCYRAINAMDGNFPDTVQQIEVVLGKNLKDAAESLASDDLAQKAYHHHLLLRFLWKQPKQHEEVRKVYLGHKDDWVFVSQHPWPLIDCYRALLLWQRRNKGDVAFAKELFTRAIDVSAKDTQHGITLSLIGAMIATVTRYCDQADTFKGVAEDLFRRCQTQMPAAAGKIGTLQRLWSARETNAIDTALQALPFYYH